MIRLKVDDLRREKAYREKRDISLRTMAQETSLAVGTVQQLVKGDVERVYLTTLDSLCRYFDVKSVADLVEYVPDGQEQAAA